MKGLRPARRRVRAQSIVEVAVTFPLLILAGVGVIQFALWMHAEGVVTAAVQDGARVASSETRTLADGHAAAAALLRDGLGPTALLVNVISTEDATAVRFEAAGNLPAIFPWGPVTTVPLHATALMARDRFIP